MNRRELLSGLIVSTLTGEGISGSNNPKQEVCVWCYRKNPKIKIIDSRKIEVHCEECNQEYFVAPIDDAEDYSDLDEISNTVFVNLRNKRVP
jgi:hypothetical protein